MILNLFIFHETMFIQFKFSTLSKMGIWVLTIFLASALVIAGLVLLLLSNQPQQKKSKIILIIGCLIYASFMISFFKHKRYFTFSLLSSVQKNDIQSAFSRTPTFKYKYPQISQNINTQDFYKTNYQSYPTSSPQRQKILFKSNPNQGASTFLYNFVKQLRRKNIPTLYAKLTSPLYIKTQDQLAQVFDLSAWQAMKASCISYSEKGIKTYLVIDNPQNIILMIPPRQIKKGIPVTILQSLIEEGLLSVIMNTQRTDNYEPIDQIIFLQQFEIKIWKGPTKALINSILSSISSEGYEISNKKVPITFKTLAQLLKMPQQEIVMKNSMGKNTLGDYWNVNDVYRKVKEVEGGRVSQIIRNKIKLSQISQLQRLGFIAINQGIVNIV